MVFLTGIGPTKILKFQSALMDNFQNIQHVPMLVI